MQQLTGRKALQWIALVDDEGERAQLGVGIDRAVGDAHAERGRLDQRAVGGCQVAGELHADRSESSFAEDERVLWREKVARHALEFRPRVRPLVDRVELLENACEILPGHNLYRPIGQKVPGTLWLGLRIGPGCRQSQNDEDDSGLHIDRSFIRAWLALRGRLEASTGCRRLPWRQCPGLRGSARPSSTP